MRITLSIMVFSFLCLGMGRPVYASTQIEDTGDIRYAWHTFYGTSGLYDDGVALAVDANNNSYILGSSTHSWNGPAGQAPLHAHNADGNMDVFILKLNSAGDYQWHTFYGGLAAPLADTYNSTNDPYDIELDNLGNIYVLATSRNSWGTPLHAHSGFSDDGQGNLFVMKLSSSGSYLWQTFYEQMRSITSNGGRGLAVSGDGNVYLASTVKLPWHDTLLTPIHPYSGFGANESWNSNMMIIKLNSTGAYQWHTFFGTQTIDRDDYAFDIDVDTSENIYITGMGSDWGVPLHLHSGASDMIALKLNTSGTYQWHTYYGSSRVDRAAGITLDPSGSIYISGTGRPFLGPTGQTPLHAFSDDGNTPYNDDTFILKLTPEGGYAWHSWYGSAGQEQAIANKPLTDSLGNVYVIGKEGGVSHPYNASSWDGPTGQPPLRAFTTGSNNNYFILKLSGTGDYQWHMFFNSRSYGFDLALDSQLNLWMTSSSTETWNGPDGQAPLHALPGGAYVVKYNSENENPIEYQVFLPLVRQ